MRWKHPTQAGVCCGCAPSLFSCSSTATALAETVCLAVHQSIHSRKTPPLVTFVKPCAYLLLNSVQHPLTPLAPIPLSSISTSYAELCGNAPNYGLLKCILNYCTIQILQLESYLQGTCQHQLSCCLGNLGCSCDCTESCMRAQPSTKASTLQYLLLNGSHCTTLAKEQSQ